MPNAHTIPETTAPHTPGPWSISGLDPNVVGPVRILVVDGADVPQQQAVARIVDRTDESLANARLIAAAPDLLACLRRMCGMYGAYSHRLAPLLAEDEGTVWTFERANSLALEAIAKAEGRS